MTLSEAIKQITDQFGKDVLAEERFVNILADVYPNRDNPAVFGIVRTLVKDGYCLDLLACNNNNVQTFISKSALALNKKYGYDKTLVEEILNSLAAGSGVTAPKNINQPAPTPAPSKQTSQKPAKPQNQAPTKPAQQPKQQKSSQKANHKHSEKTKGIVLLALSFFGLFLGTILYALYLDCSWWMFFTLLLIMIVHLLTIAPGILLFDYKNKTYSRIYSGVLLFAFLNYLAPLSFPSDFIEENYTFYCGHMNLDGTEGVILGIYALVFWGGLFCSLIDKDSILNILNKKSFIITVIVLSMIYGLFLYIPEWDKQKAINDILAEVNKKESRSGKLKAQRAGEVKNLQFKGIELLSSRCDFMNAVMRDSNFSVKETIENKGKYVLSELELSYDGIRYEDVIESVVCCDVKWDNKKLKAKTYFMDDLVIAISISDKDYGDHDYLNLSDILSMYTRKYGEPELTFGSGYNTTFYMVNHNYSPSYRNEILKDSTFIENLIYGYNWTYKNGGIEIKRNQYPSYLSITYASSLLMEKYKKRTEQVKKQENIKKKRERDSLNRVKVEQEKMEKQERIKREKEHQKSMEQI